MLTNNQRPYFSVCVPAYNRSLVLPDLLDSVFKQDENDFEVIICEDFSKERNQIKEIISNYSHKYPNKIKYFENEFNLGYDSNFKELIEKSSGKYCFFLGNDDLMAEGALKHVRRLTEQNSNIGFVLRSYATFDNTVSQIDQVFKYFNEVRLFEPSIDSMVTCFKRSVVICGLVFERDIAQSFKTDEYDGTLLYQQHLVCEILKSKNAIYTPQVLAYYRNGGVPEFGNSQKEKGLHIPGQQTPESSIHFMKGMLFIAKSKSVGMYSDLYKFILKDLSNYSYPFIAIQSKQSKIIFLKYYADLFKMGFGRVLLFHIYFWALFVLGQKMCDLIIKKIKSTLGYTPKLGRVSSGKTTHL